MRLDDIRYDDMTRISSINRHVKNGSHAMTRHIRNFHLLHQFIIANGHDMTIYGSLDTVSADFMNIPDTVTVNGFTIRLLQALTDGM